jgi:hypothetical protein
MYKGAKITLTRSQGTGKYTPRPVYLAAALSTSGLTDRHSECRYVWCGCVRLLRGGCADSQRAWGRKNGNVGSEIGYGRDGGRRRTRVIYRCRRERLGTGAFWGLGSMHVIFFFLTCIGKNLVFFFFPFLMEKKCGDFNYAHS